MKKILLVVILFIVFSAWTNRRIASAFEEVKAEWSIVETAFEFRLELLDELEAATSRIGQFEPIVAQSLKDAYLDAVEISDKVTIAEEIESSFERGILALENDAKAIDASAKKLIADVRSADEKLANARSSYNAAVRAYNSRLAKFPGSVIGAVSGFSPLTYFQAGDI